MNVLEQSQDRKLRILQPLSHVERATLAHVLALLDAHIRTPYVLKLVRSGCNDSVVNTFQKLGGRRVKSWLGFAPCAVMTGGFVTWHKALIYAVDVFGSLVHISLLDWLFSVPPQHAVCEENDVNSTNGCRDSTSNAKPGSPA